MEKIFDAKRNGLLKVLKVIGMISPYLMMVLGTYLNRNQLSLLPLFIFLVLQIILALIIYILSDDLNRKSMSRNIFINLLLAIIFAIIVYKVHK
ncbi:hypothetical protein EGI31_17710 [Lacihabitans soyangensis]|uniref:Uncharacterized protein n=1 Tax=Lacihabitans soyangensis TaxID=869394 RepID=A0AAE3H437_9BACT|nr:hypothetical protein [Lacihabitans soyangensis]